MTTPKPDYGVECVKAYDEYAAKHGYSPTCPPGDLTPYRDWIKPVGDPEIRPGDIITFGFDGIKHGRPSDYGYVEVVTRRTVWRYRLATLRRCLMWWKR